MSERNLYRGTSDFQGSIDEDGNLYDERHRLVGRIEGDAVYDFCNIRQGTIDENGKLWDVNHDYVGQAHGSNFIGPSYRSIGMTRGDSVGDGDGTEYGALMMLKKRNEYYSGKTPDNDYNFGNGYESNDDEDDDDDDERADWNDGDTSYSSAPSCRHADDGGHQDFEFSGFGCLVVALVLGGQFLFFVIMYLYVMR